MLISPNQELHVKDNQTINILPLLLEQTGNTACMVIATIAKAENLMVSFYVGEERQSNVVHADRWFEIVGGGVHIVYSFFLRMGLTGCFVNQLGKHYTCSLVLGPTEVEEQVHWCAGLVI